MNCRILLAIRSYIVLYLDVSSLCQLLRTLLCIAVLMKSLVISYLSGKRLWPVDQVNIGAFVDSLCIGTMDVDL